MSLWILLTVLVLNITNTISIDFASCPKFISESSIVGAKGPLHLLGDVNGDGINDFYITADPIFNIQPAVLSIIYGKQNGLVGTTNVSNGLDPADGFQIKGSQNYTYLTVASPSTGDFNNDGISDILFLSGDVVYIIYGTKTNRADSVSIDDELDVAHGFSIKIGTKQASFSWIGDINSDGASDLAIGRSLTREVYVIYGNSKESSTSIDSLEDLPSSQGFKISGDNNGLGYVISGLGDTNKDGIDDFVIGSQGSNSEDESIGSAFVIYGREADFTSNINMKTDFDKSVGFEIKAPSNTGSNEVFFDHISSAGDFNDDGIQDIILSLMNVAPLKEAQAGKAYIVYGKSGERSKAVDLTNTLKETDGVIINKASSKYQFGGPVSFAGDVNGDKIDDVMIGEIYNREAQEAAVYIVFGGDYRGFKEVDLTGKLDSIGFKYTYSSSELMLESSYAGDVNGDGFSDIILRDRILYTNPDCYEAIQKNEDNNENDPQAAVQDATNNYHTVLICTSLLVVSVLLFWCYRKQRRNAARYESLSEQG